MQGHATDQLDVEVAHAHHPLASLANHGEGFGQQLVERFALGVALLEFSRFRLQLLVGERHHLGLERIDGLYSLGHALYITLVLASKSFFNKGANISTWSSTRGEWKAHPSGGPCRSTA